MSSVRVSRVESGGDRAAALEVIKRVFCVEKKLDQQRAEPDS